MEFCLSISRDVTQSQRLMKFVTVHRLDGPRKDYTTGKQLQVKAT